jgi:hypothetical protein
MSVACACSEGGARCPSWSRVLSFVLRACVVLSITCAVRAVLLQGVLRDALSLRAEFPGRVEVERRVRLELACEVAEEVVLANARYDVA